MENKIINEEIIFFKKPLGVASYKTRYSLGRADENHEKLKSILPAIRLEFKLGISQTEIQNTRINLTPREKNTREDYVEWNQLLGLCEHGNELMGSIKPGNPLTAWTTAEV
jgi:hypothetical protein